MINAYMMGDQMPRGQYAMLVSDLLDTQPIQVGEWQAMDVSKSDLHKTHELEDVVLSWDRVPAEPRDVFPMIDYDWADEHFSERVSGQPLNPAPSHLNWPYAVRGNADHTKPTSSGKLRQRENPILRDTASGPQFTQADQFDHTYPERFWPKGAGWPMNENRKRPEMHGIRFSYGDLSDVVDLLVRSPLTRQAFLPIWFPEDTGATEGQRVPCTLGYHFMQRGGRLSVRYYLRSCDVYRHLSNDVYFTTKLLSWVCGQVTDRSRETATPMHFRPGGMNIYISSLHAFVGDKTKLNDRLDLNHAAALLELL